MAPIGAVLGFCAGRGCAGTARCRLDLRARVGTMGARALGRAAPDTTLAALGVALFLVRLRAVLAAGRLSFLRAVALLRLLPALAFLATGVLRRALADLVLLRARVALDFLRGAISLCCFRKTAER